MHTIGLTEEGATEHALVGGKGANLGRLAAAGFEVPPGFVVTTDAYAQVLQGEQVADPAQMAERVLSLPVPDDIASAIRDAYDAMGGGRVAVRSSGTAEDLADASFAGLHDTHLDIEGHDALIDAVRRCWSSLWTARAVAYRGDKGFDHGEARLAVVVQQMVAAESAGVMFTANPITAAVDEIVINAAYGLGEAVVSGLVTPDEITLHRDDLHVRRRSTGEKAQRIDRADGPGTVTSDVPEDERAKDVLDDDRAADLADLGRRVTAYYEGFPQDIEWAYADGVFHLLQARPVTGVELCWDEDLEFFHLGAEEDPEHDDFVYSRAWSDDFSIAAVTPLYYTTRSKEWSDCFHDALVLYGHDDAAKIRSWKYHKGEAYYSSNMEAAWIQRLLPPYLRNAGSMNKLPPSWWEQMEQEPFSYTEFLKILARIRMLHGRSGPYAYVGAFRERIDDPETAHGKTDEELRELSDRQFRAYLDERLELWKQADLDQWGAFFIYAPFAMGTLADLLVRWYDGDIAQAFAELLSGLDAPSITLIENHELWEFGERIRASETLRRALDEHQGAAFFEALKSSEEGQAFLADYEPWKVKRGHRGAADREFLLPRRADDPNIDYTSFKALMAGDGSDPLVKEEEHRAKRRRREADVERAFRSGSFGALKVEAFRLLSQWSLTFMAHRDDEREYLDLLAYTQRRCFMELGRRLAERGLTDEVEDVFFLGLNEGWDLLFGATSERLCRAKIAGRRRNYERRKVQEVLLPPYVGVDGAPALPGENIGMLSADASSEEDGKTVMPGVGTSSGTVTGRARVIGDMADIGTLEQGDILICHATDPGWTPVFLVISGLVMQTGGVLAHGSCLSREYGLPAVVLPQAMSRIEDGATITIDGDLGRVVIEGAMIEA